MEGEKLHHGNRHQGEAPATDTGGRVEFSGEPALARWVALVSDLVSGQVRAVDGAGQEMAVIDSPDEPGGLGWSPDGHLLVVGVTERKLLRYNGRWLTEFADLSGLTDYYLEGLVG